MTTANRRKILDMLGEGKISAVEAERLLDALGRRRTDEPDIASLVDDGVNIVTNAVERLTVDIEDAIDGSDAEFDRRTFTVQGEPRVEVNNFCGRVELRGGSEDGEVHVDAELSHPDRVDYTARQDGDTIRVEARPSGRRSFFGWLPFNRGVRITILLPRRADLEINNANGRVLVRNVEGSGSITTSNGRIVAEELSGAFGFTTSNSGIESRQLSGRYEMATSNGRIIVAGGRGEYRVETSNGRIRFDGELEAGSCNSFKTSNGSIVASLGTEPDVRLSAATSNGSIRCLQHLDSVDTDTKRRVEGTMGDGQASLKLRTSNGSITID